MQQSLEATIRSLEPRSSIIHDCLGMGRFAEVTFTSDGFFLARAHGDCGFNYFLGWPTQQAIIRAKNLFDKLTPEHQQELIRRLRECGIPPRALGIPEPAN